MSRRALAPVSPRPFAFLQPPASSLTPPACSRPGFPPSLVFELHTSTPPVAFLPPHFDSSTRRVFVGFTPAEPQLEATRRESKKAASPSVRLARAEATTESYRTPPPLHQSLPSEVRSKKRSRTIVLHWAAQPSGVSQAKLGLEPNFATGLAC